jgi:MoaA/NifB/PqqE/SkfB family radical SAM enzyme
LFNFKEVHIEVSSKCTLKCPRCPRTELKPEQLNQEFSLAEFMSAFPPDMLDDIGTVLFCGDVGDPIYATEFIEIVAYLKRNKTQVKIVTNGSYKSVEWWDRLAHLLGKQDHITFSVDGWDQASNNMYRVNSNYDSIVAGIKTVRAASPCHITLSTIVFSFNELHLDVIKSQAKELGVDHFQIVNSTKFDGRYAVNGIDTLKPVAYAQGNNYIKSKFLLSDRHIPLVFHSQINRHAWAKCLNWKVQPFINVDGLVFPCAWFNSGYQDNDFVQTHREKLSVKNRPLKEIMLDPIWDEFITRLEMFPLEICKLKCKDDQ